MVGLVEVEVVLRVVDLANEISIVLQLRSMPFSIFIPIYEINLLISRGIPCAHRDSCKLRRCYMYAKHLSWGAGDRLLIMAINARHSSYYNDR